MPEIIRFPAEVLQFRQELANHPDIYEEASKLTSFEEIIGFVGVKVGVAIDGGFSQPAMLRLLDTLTEKLYQRRNITLVDVSGQPIINN